MSESQERMMAVVEPGDVDGFMAICAKWDVEAVVIGEVTDSGRLEISWHGEVVVDVPPRTVAHDGPVYERPFARPDWQDALQADGAEALPRPSAGDELRKTLLELVASPNLCDKSWITDQYDRYVQGNTVLAQPADSGMVRVDEETHLGVSVATDCNGRFAKLDPYAGAQLALAEAYRNVATGGARPLAVSDCLNFGSPEDTDVMWQFAEACRGLKDACITLGIPVTGGNVSLYNQTGETAILPTPVVAVLGVIDDVRRRTPTAFSVPASGSCCSARPGRSSRAASGRTSSTSTSVVRRRRSTWPPSATWPGCSPTWSASPPAPTTSPTAASPRRWPRPAWSAASARRWRSTGSPTRLRRPVLRVGRPRDRHRRGRASIDELRALCARHGVPMTEIGTTGGDALAVEGAFDVPLDELRTAWTSTLPAALGA